MLKNTNTKSKYSFLLFFLFYFLLIIKFLSQLFFTKEKYQRTINVSLLVFYSIKLKGKFIGKNKFSLTFYLYFRRAISLWFDGSKSYQRHLIKGLFSLIDP